MKKSTRRDKLSGRQEVARADAPWLERWERLGAANETARRERLRTLTLESAIREFEELCREVHAAFDSPSAARSHPVGLVKYTRGVQASR